MQHHLSRISPTSGHPTVLQGSVAAARLRSLPRAGRRDEGRLRPSLYQDGHRRDLGRPRQEAVLGRQDGRHLLQHVAAHLRSSGRDLACRTSGPSSGRRRPSTRGRRGTWPGSRSAEHRRAARTGTRRLCGTLDTVGSRRTSTKAAW